MADVLVLSVESWPGATEITSPETCCEECQAWPGCNLFVFCSNSGGCGQGCENALQESEGNTDDPKKFGPDGKCNGDKYAAFTCTLKRSANPEDPVDYGDGPTGWVTGTASSY
jgi:hypothetical protein